jgi:ornithine cyclodeaminase/alanine dehydrogenase-like protein (mu-crystallin family)
MNLDEADVGRLLRMEEVIPAMERALADFSGGKVVQPVRTMLPVEEHQGFLGIMPAYTGTALGTKLVAFYPKNVGVPTHHATLLLLPHRPRCFMGIGSRRGCISTRSVHPAPTGVSSTTGCSGWRDCT